MAVIGGIESVQLESLPEMEPEVWSVIQMWWKECGLVSRRFFFFVQQDTSVSAAGRHISGRSTKPLVQRLNRNRKPQHKRVWHPEGSGGALRNNSMNGGGARFGMTWDKIRDLAILWCEIREMLWKRTHIRLKKENNNNKKVNKNPFYFHR